MSDMFDDLWRLLNEYSFVVIDLNLHIDMKCGICNKLFIRPSNIPCGCRFCYECIVKYLLEYDKYCPNKLKYCKIKPLNPDKDVVLDYPMNIKMEKLIVKCVNDSCDVEDELCSIETHLKSCQKNKTTCPYVHIGCNEDQIAYDKINIHLNEQNFFHTNLLISWINNDFSKKTVKNLETDGLNQSEKKELNEKIETLEINLKTVKKEIEFLKENKIDGQSISQFSNDLLLKSLDNNIKSLMKENRFNKEWFEGEMAKSILSINSNSASQAKDISDLKTLWQKTETDQKKVIEKIEEFRKTISNLSNNLNQIEQIVNEKINNLQKKIVELELNSERKENIGDFLWKIDNFSKKIKEIKKSNNMKLYSDPFISHYKGYKLCLCLWQFDEYLCCGFCILRGQFDSSLEWPAKFDVIINLIDQNTGSSFKTRTLTFNTNANNDAWKRPKNEKNIGFGDKLIKIDNLLNNASLIVDDKIFIKCALNIL